MKFLSLIILILFAALIFDIAYGVATAGTSYGCTIIPPSANSSQSLSDPCFYIYYYGIVGGSMLVILILPPYEFLKTSQAEQPLEK